MNSTNGGVNMDSKKRLKNLIGQLSVNYRRDITEADMANFKLMISKWGFDAFEKGVQDHLFDPDQGQFFPTIASISKQINGSSKQNEVEAKDRAEIAWASVYEQIGRVGSYGTLKLDDKRAIAAVKAIGGWVDLTQRTYQELEWKKKAFFSAYDSFDRVPLEELPGNAPGLIAQDKAKKSEPKSLSSLSKGLDEYRKSQGMPPIGDILNATTKGE